VTDDRDEDRELRSVTLETARSIFLARQRAEEELARAQEALRKQSEWLRVTLASIGDGVLTTDTDGRVLSLNSVAQSLCGWTEQDARGRRLAEVFRLVDEQNRRPVENPAERALREGRVVELVNHSVLIAKDGSETPIDDSAAPIRDETGRVHGAVLIFRSIAERRRSEVALRESEQELSDFFENASVGLHWAGPDGTVLRVNRAELELLGYTRDEYVGRHIAEFHADRNVIDDMLRRLSLGETIRDCETRMRCKDGSIKDVLIDSSVMWKDGRFVHTRTFTRDITDRRRGEAAQARLAAIVESSQDAIISKTLDSRIVSWNAGAEDLFGYTGDEAIGRPITILIPPELQDEERMILGRLRRGERIEHYETVRVTKSGRRVDVSLTVSPLRDAAGRVVGASKIVRDVTSRRQAEEKTRFLADASAALAELTDQESTLQRVAALAVPRFADWCVVDILDANGMLRRLAVAHVDPDRVRLVRELDRRYPSRASDTRGIRQVIRSGQPEWASSITDGMLEEVAQDPEHLRIIRDLKPRSYICVPLRSRAQVLGTLSFVTAESGRNYGADDVRAAEDLAHRTVIAMENGSLLASLREADRRKDEFLAMLAHELRNPLAPIRNAVQIFRAKGPAVPELQWATELIDRQIHQMTRLVDDLLDVSRITRGKVELRREIVELGTVVENAVEASRPLIEKWGHELTVTVPAQPVRLDADPIRLAQVISNLLNNSAKYTRRGGRIALAAEAPGDQVLIRIKDNGIGISADLLPRVFDLFTQAGRSVEHSDGGLGIGLTLVQRLTEMHGGSVEARSDGPGKGSEFVVRLPVARDTRRDGDVVPEPGALSPAPSALRILVVDDNPDAADSLGMVLRMMGHEVHTAHDGLEAVGAATAFQPEVVLLDIGLPKLNGYEVARRIRDQPAGTEVLLVALSGWGQEEDRQRAREAGFDGHMTKPVDVRALQRLLETSLAAGRRRKDGQ
jgi:PAS domain S-box-containing protein